MSIVDKVVAGTPCWFDLMTPDPEGARKFYGELFGWTFDVSGPEMGHYAMCKKGEHNTAGMGKMPENAPFPTCWTVYLATENSEASIEAIRANGGQVNMGPMDVPGEQGRMTVAVDPTGAVFGLWQPMKHRGSTLRDEHGAMTWAECATRESAKAAEFYSKVLGAEAKKLDTEGMDYTTLNVGGMMTSGIMQMDASFPPAIPAHWMGYFSVDDADAACEKIKSLGGKVMHGPFDSPYGRIAVVTDPYGAVFSIIKNS